MRHLAEGERATFRVLMAGQDVPRLFTSPADDPGNQHGSGGGSMSLREVLAGMIEEYARHLGHADLLRERIDGRLGQ